MRVFVYDNKEKDVGGVYLQKLCGLLNGINIKYRILNDDDLLKDDVADAIFSIGGDGTILWLVEFANRNEIPIVGINVGKLGFLSEFERGEMEEAVEEININYTGEALDLGFNVTYLLDVLSNLKNSEVRFAFSTAEGATLLTMPDSDQFRYVLMPMRI